MNIIFLGSIFPVDREDEIKSNSKSGIDNAANNLQSALLVGLDYYYPKINVITLPVIATYPMKYKKSNLNDSMFSHKPDSIDYCVGFINIPLIKHLSRYKNSFKKISELTEKDEDIIIFIYAVHSPFLKAICELKKVRPRLKTCLIIPDLPQFMSESKNPFYRLFKYLDLVIINKYLKKIDSLVLLSDNMANFINVNERPWVRVEGIFNSDKETNFVKKENNRTILYTGNIDERYGIKTLLKAFSLIKDKNYRLWIRGNGNTKNDIIEAAKSDSRIIYYEEMSRKKILELQKKATVLINPVSTTKEFTKFFFPSKIMDYMASGTPTISTKILGIPEEYYNYLYIADNDDAEGLKKIILQVCSKEQIELNEFGKRASQFIFDNKNPIVQVKRIYDMINKL